MPIQFRKKAEKEAVEESRPEAEAATNKVLLTYMGRILDQLRDLEYLIVQLRANMITEDSIKTFLRENVVSRGASVTDELLISTLSDLTRSVSELSDKFDSISDGISEIRSLGEEIAKANRGIAATIASIEHLAKRFSELSDKFDSVSDGISEIRSFSEEVARVNQSITALNELIGELSNMIQNLTTLLGDIGSYIRKLTDTAAIQATHHRDSSRREESPKKPETT